MWNKDRNRIIKQHQLRIDKQAKTIDMLVSLVSQGLKKKCVLCKFHGRYGFFGYFDNRICRITGEDVILQTNPRLHSCDGFKKLEDKE